MADKLEILSQWFFQKSYTELTDKEAEFVLDQRDEIDAKQE